MGPEGAVTILARGDLDIPFNPHDPASLSYGLLASMVVLDDGTVVLADSTNGCLVAVSPMDDLQMELERLVGEGLDAAQHDPDRLARVRDDLAALRIPPPTLDQLDAVEALAGLRALHPLIAGYLSPPTPARLARIRLAEQCLERAVARLGSSRCMIS
jgi:hypothetical protein